MFDPTVFLTGEEGTTSSEGNELLQHEMTDFSSTIHTLDTNTFGSNEWIYQHSDPLSQAQSFTMPKANLHVVSPHFVEGYIRQDGTVVEGYYRNGGLEDGSYLRTNPDERLDNNLNSK